MRLASRSRDPRDRERAQRRSSQESLPREGDKWEEREREQSPVEPPISREGDQRSSPAETEESTGEGSASTSERRAEPEGCFLWRSPLHHRPVPTNATYHIRRTFYTPTPHTCRVRIPK